ncbi:MAG TPA: hypothetical protein VN969_09245 [Streptosporangiaceae bacterium]|nr:hypothetical protein [Streptosporangiaceae bacterium]
MTKKLRSILDQILTLDRADILVLTGYALGYYQMQLKATSADQALRAGGHDRPAYRPAQRAQEGDLTMDRDRINDPAGHNGFVLETNPGYRRPARAAETPSESGTHARPATRR